MSMKPEEGNLQFKSINLYDSHIHLDQNPFYSNIEQFIEEWKTNNVKKVLAVTTNEKSWRRVNSIQTKWQNIFIGCGWHPWEVKKGLDEQQISKYEQYIKNAAFIGEIGLDHHFVTEKSRYPFQEEIFVFMLDLAKQANLACTIHSKGAEAEVYKIVQNHSINPQQLIIHWYSGSLTNLCQLKELGCFFSLTPAIKYSTHRLVAEYNPIDKLLTESDGPVKYQGIYGSPVLIKETLHELAVIKGMSLQDVAGQIEKNMQQFFSGARNISS